MVDQSMSFEGFMRERHAELSVFVVTLASNPAGPQHDYGSAEGREMLRRHFLYWWELEEQGKLLGAGPTDVGTPEQAGMALLICATREEAEKLARDEPCHRAGWRVNSVRPWQPNEGSAVPLVRQHLQEPPAPK
jgi:uncharacterized protein YciI